MLSKKDIGILLHIVDHCDRITKIIQNAENKKPIKLQMVLDALCFNLMQIGELVIALSDMARSKNIRVPWNDIKNMRHKIVHGYGTIDFDIVIDTSINDIPILKQNIIEILDKESA